MVVDTSVLVAIVLGEPDAETFLFALRDTPQAVHLSTISLLEATMVVESRQGTDATRDLDLLVSLIGAVVEPFSALQASMAVAAWRRFGKGRHPAALNLGDCCVYALARDLDEPLLYKGGDFGQTDIAAVLP